MYPFIAQTYLLLVLASAALHAQVPQLINYQGRVAVGKVNFDGPGQFKFALADAGGTTTLWSNDGTSTAGSEPVAAVTLVVTGGFYSAEKLPAEKLPVQRSYLCAEKLPGN